jgi:hypothetical protein
MRWLYFANIKRTTRNSHFHPSKPDLPPSWSSPLAMSPLTALAIAYIDERKGKSMGEKNTHLNSPEPPQSCRKLSALIESTKID